MTTPLRFGLFGHPLDHSLSPEMHLAAYRAMGLDATYTAVPLPDAGRIPAIAAAMGLGGASVTMPHKEALLRYLDQVTPAARRIGAVNTLAAQGGRWVGLNTDAAGFERALESALTIAGRRFAVLGAGGAARAVVFALAARGGEVTVLNRDEARGRALAETFGCGFLPLGRLRGLEGDAVVNATPLGMSPHEGATAAEGADLAGFGLAVDLIYNPPRTLFLERAAQAGCRILNGVGMFVYQAAEQIRVWTGREAPLDVMFNTLEARLAHAADSDA